MHVIIRTPGGAECSCGREFSVWKTTMRNTSHDALRTRNLMRANARRHATAANMKEAVE